MFSLYGGTKSLNAAKNRNSSVKLKVVISVQKSNVTSNNIWSDILSKKKTRNICGEIDRYMYMKINLCDMSFDYFFKLIILAWQSRRC